MASGISSERHQALAWGSPRQVDNLNPAKFRLLERDRRLFIGVGAAKRPYLQRRLGADQMALLRRLKTAFDPAGILNPGKLGS